MKAIAVLRHPGDCVETAPRMQLIADSAMVGAGALVSARFRTVVAGTNRAYVQNIASGQGYSSAFCGAIRRCVLSMRAADA